VHPSGLAVRGLFAAGPGDMPGRVALYLDRTGQVRPIGPGGLVCCILQSLALKEAERLAAEQLNLIHVVGGGAKNGFLNQLVADATDSRVIAGPYMAKTSFIADFSSPKRGMTLDLRRSSSKERSVRHTLLRVSDRWNRGVGV
jgi:rhamnulokinase